MAPPLIEIIDLTHPLTPNTPTYPGDPPFRSTPQCTIPADGFSVHHLSLGTHTGTHIDAPSHFISSGKSIGQIPLSELVARPVVVVDLSKEGMLGPRQEVRWEGHLKKHLDSKTAAGVEVVIVYTGWSKWWGTPTYFEHPYLTKEAAEKMVEKGVRVVAVDTLSPDETDGDAGLFGVHETVLGAGGLIVENLANVDRLLSNGDGDGTEWLVSFVPLYLGGEEDGSPVRAFAWKK